MRGWTHLPQHIVKWRANLQLAAVAQRYEEGDRRSLENTRKAVSWDAATICEMRSKIAGRGSWPCYAPHIGAMWPPRKVRPFSFLKYYACVALLGAPWGGSGVSKSLEQGSGGGVVGLNLKSKACWKFQCQPGGTSTPPLQTLLLSQPQGGGRGRRVKALGSKPHSTPVARGSKARTPQRAG